MTSPNSSQRSIATFAAVLAGVFAPAACASSGAPSDETSAASSTSSAAASCQVGSGGAGGGQSTASTGGATSNAAATSTSAASTSCTSSAGAGGMTGVGGGTGSGGGGGGGGGGVDPSTFQNGVEYPTSFVPFSPSSPWNSKVPPNPNISSYSDAVISVQFANGNDKPVRGYEPGPFDYAYSIVYAKDSDPLVNLDCNGYCDENDHGGLPAQIRIPAQARPPGFGGVGCQGCYEDAPLAIIQPDGTEIDTAYGDNFSPGTDWVDGMTFHVGGAANCGSWLPGAGNDGMYGTGTGATAGGNCLAAGQLRANELISGHIDHALKMVLECSGSQGSVPPAFDGAATQVCTGGENAGPPLGARLWYDVPCADTQASNLWPWEKAILCALNEYGAYFMDNIGGGDHASGMLFLPSAGEMFYDFGQPDPYAALASQGWTAIDPSQISGAQRPRWVGADPWQPSGVDFLSHMHYIDP